MYLSDSEINEAVTEIGNNQGGDPTLGEGSPTQTMGQPPASYDPNLVINYKASGRDLAEPLSAVIQRAQRGYDYGNLVAQMKTREQQIAERETKAQQLEGKWKPYDEYANQNPAWADFVRSNWESRLNWNGNSQQPSQLDNVQSTGQVPPELMKEIGELKTFKQQWEQQQVIARQAEEDVRLNQHIEQTKTQYPDIDFSHTDPATGMSLEMRVLQHASQNGIHNFGAAFRDFYHDQLLNRAIVKSREEVGKQVQSQHKQGFLAQSDKSMMNNGQPTNITSHRGSYHDSIMQGAKEMGLL